MGNIKVVINKVVISKLRKEVARVNFSFKKRGVAVYKRLKREWVSHDLRGNKVECPPLKVAETPGYLCNIHTKKMMTSIRDIHAKIRERTHREFVRHSHKEEWDNFTQKRGKKVWHSTQNKVNV